MPGRSGFEVVVVGLLFEAVTRRSGLRARCARSSVPSSAPGPLLVRPRSLIGGPHRRPGTPRGVAPVSLQADALPGPPSYGAPVEIVGTAKRTWARAQGLSPWVLDGVLAATMVVLGSATRSGPTAVGARPTARDGLAVVLLLAATVPYVVRSRYPFGVFVTTYVALVLYVGLGYNEGLLPIFVLVGM